MSVLLLTFDAPMQSWGQRSRSTFRDTASEPTKSGVIGLLAAALGIARDEDERIRQLAMLRMGVRVDQEGVRDVDYHTAQNVAKADSSGDQPVVSRRHYLADALFLVALEEGKAQLHELHQALHSPHWPLYFGRRSFVPARPVVAPDPTAAICDLPLEEVLRTHPWTGCGTPPTEHLRTVIDTTPTDPGAELRYDVPHSFRSHDRQYCARYVRTGHVPCTPPLLPATPAESTKKP
ncbi:type I-E CRISPR-associated protein Cas5/CasD [Streptomyces noursei]|uniref:type I-E CRISPR-associated protein Cas5/CasD n=1 Tax=Streptomyces noursei TaxID=1971 RepID=UPI0016769DF3|nr:type I-E CRISPR-associated protein Cas5/CasD [Streptomyces noursei]MCZ1018927.1 type I-E CRISPR-associated protein Cas5/CasD [Streptomyces noursei]GGX22792.1 type I-E CRISPR-associated protein Cas5/CasD [Streptomyces noursei]